MKTPLIDLLILTIICILAGIVIYELYMIDEAIQYTKSLRK